MHLGKPALLSACDLFCSDQEGLRGENILSKTLFLILLLTLAQILLRAAQISSEKPLKRFKMSFSQFEGFCLANPVQGRLQASRPLLCCDAAQGHSNPPCDIQQQQQQQHYAVNTVSAFSQPTTSFGEELRKKPFSSSLFFFGGGGIVNFCCRK